MARCAGCSGEGCFCNLQVLDTETVNMFLTGNGSTETPWTISATAEGGGGGDCQQKNLYTVATVGPSGLGFDLGTPDPFLDCADFIGDGINDNVAIQAAIDAAQGGMVALTIWPEVYLNAGLFMTAAAINCKGIPIRGCGTSTFISNNATATGFPLLRNPGLLSYVNLGPIIAANNHANIAVDTATGISPRLDHCEMTTSGIGAAAGVIYFTIASAFTMERCNISNNLGGVPLPISLPSMTGRLDIKDNTFTGVYLDISNDVLTGSQICNNLFFGNSSTAFASARGLITLRTTSAVTIAELQITDNYIVGSPGHGIYLDGASGGLLEGNLIHDNQVRQYGQTGASAFDGIHLAGNVDMSDIQGNVCYSLAAGARHGINIAAAAAQDNFVTNNNLFSSGAGTSLNDAGTSTVTTAGNRL